MNDEEFKKHQELSRSTDAELKQVEDEVNKKIKEEIKVETIETTKNWDISR